MNCKLTHLWFFFLAFMDRLKRLFKNLLLPGDGLCLTLHDHEYDANTRSDEGLTLETSAFLPFTVANLRFQPSC